MTEIHLWTMFLYTYVSWKNEKGSNYESAQYMKGQQPLSPKWETPLFWQKNEFDCLTDSVCDLQRTVVEVEGYS